MDEARTAIDECALEDPNIDTVSAARTIYPRPAKKKRRIVLVSKRNKEKEQVLQSRYTHRNSESCKCRSGTE